MRVDLNVPYEDKDQAKALGARWDPAAKVWYVPDGLSPEAFTRWARMRENADNSPYIYLVLAKRVCWSCEKETEVVGFGIPYSTQSYDEEVGVDYLSDFGHVYLDTITADSLAIVNPIGCVPAEIRTYIEKRCGYKKTFSKTVGDFQMANNCTHCGRLQGNFMLFEEADSPFFVNNMDDIEKLSFIKVRVEGVYGEPNSYSTADKALFNYAATHHTEFPEKLIEGIYL